MKAFVFTDESLRAEAGRFVWLAVDTEKEKNAPVVEKYPIDAWPTYLVVDPQQERVALRWVGAATVPQLKRILDDGAAAVKGAAVPGVTEAAFARAERHYAARDFPAAAKAYQEALASAPAGWPGYFRAVESLLFSLSKQDDCATALAVAREALPRLRRAPSAVTVAYSGLDCALRLPETDPARTDTVALFETAAREILADPRVTAAADDRSSLHAALLEARRSAKDEAGATKAAADWARFLDEQAARAQTPEARTVFDSHRLTAALEMGDPARAIPMLEQSERDFPKDYNPPARLAVVYKELKRWDEALAATDRALARAYGPRMLRILGTRADVQLAKGDAAAARATLEKALKTAKDLPPGQRSERAIGAIEKRLAALAGPSAQGRETAPASQRALPEKEFSHPPQKPHDPAALVFTFDQLEHFYRPPGEYTHRLTGEKYGFDALSFFVTETHPFGGPGLHVHDTEEAHVLLAGAIRYRIGEETFTVEGPYVARVPAGVPHTFMNVGTAPFNLIAVFPTKRPGTRRIGPNPLIPAAGAPAPEPEATPAPRG